MNLPILWNRNSAKVDQKVLQLINFQTAWRQQVMFLGVKHGKQLEGLAASEGGKQFLEDLFRTVEFRQKLQAATRLLNLSHLTTHITLIAAERFQAEIRSHYPVELQLPVVPSITMLIDRADALREKVMLINVQGYDVYALVADVPGRRYIQNRMAHKEFRMEIIRRTNLPPEAAPRLTPVFRDATPFVIERAIKEHYAATPTHVTRGEINALERETERKFSPLQPAVHHPLTAINAPTVSDPIDGYFNLMMGAAYDQRVADVKFTYDLETESIIVHYNLNGAWHPQHPYHIGHTNRYLAFINYAANRAKLGQYKYTDPREGHIDFEIAVNGAIHRFGARVNFFPKAYPNGLFLPKLTNRLLLPSHELLSIEELGFHPWQHASVTRLLAKRTGLILFVGQMNTGKNMSVLSFMRRIYETNQSFGFQSVENPIEIRLEWMDQTQVHHGQSPEELMRSVFRTGSKVLYVPEINSPEMAELTLKLAESGHLVFSTIHCNSPQDVVMRLRGLGIDGGRIASVLQGVVSQRLLPKLCPHCAVNATGEDLFGLHQEHFMALGPILKHYRYLTEKDGTLTFLGFFPKTVPPKTQNRCASCQHTGIIGRQAIFEIWHPGYQQFNIQSGALPLALRSMAIEFFPHLYGEHGYTTLTAAALAHVAQGTVSPAHLREYLGEPDPRLEGITGYNYEELIETIKAHQKVPTPSPYPSSSTEEEIYPAKPAIDVEFDELPNQ